MTSDPRGLDPRPTIGDLLADPTVRRSLKTVLRDWTSRDPVDAAEDAGLLALALERRADEACGLVLVLVAPLSRPRPEAPGG